MKTTLVALNAKYPHTNPAVRSIAGYARAHGVRDIGFVEHTVNQRVDVLLPALYALGSDIYIFSCYIWNIELVRELAAELRKLLPDAKLWAGGPEVGYDARGFLERNPAFDLVIRGEGEETVTDLILALQNNGSAAISRGLTWRGEDGIQETPDTDPPNLDDLPFPYDDLPNLTGRAIYCESMRGCPFRCSYCISSIESGVRFRSLPLVFADLQRCLDAGVHRVKFVDRTFNCNRDHAEAVWRYLIRHDNGVTNFHFELAGELITDSMIELLKSARPGLFQFEIGVQSTNPETLRAIHRPADLNKLFQAVRCLQEPRNIHLHLDLIAGLPFEDYDRFCKSFGDVYALRPHQFQLGFLKVLRGSGIERNAERFGIVYRGRAPYEVLRTNWLSFDELSILQGVEEMVDLYYNSGRFSHIVEHLCSYFGRPYAFYRALSRYWKHCGYSTAPPDKIGQYELLAGFMDEQGIPADPTAKWLCKYDLLLHEKPRRLPRWVDVDETGPDRSAIRAFWKRKEADATPLNQASMHLDRFPFDPPVSGTAPVWLLFDYSDRDITGRARVHRISDCFFSE